MLLCRIGRPLRSSRRTWYMCDTEQAYHGTYPRTQHIRSSETPFEYLYVVRSVRTTVRRMCCVGRMLLVWVFCRGLGDRCGRSLIAIRLPSSFLLRPSVFFFCLTGFDHYLYRTCSPRNQKKTPGNKNQPWLYHTSTCLLILLLLLYVYVYVCMHLFVACVYVYSNIIM